MVVDPLIVWQQYVSVHQGRSVSTTFKDQVDHTYVHRPVWSAAGLAGCGRYLLWLLTSNIEEDM